MEHMYQFPLGKRLHNCDKSSCLMGNSSINSHFQQLRQSLPEGIVVKNSWLQLSQFLVGHILFLESIWHHMVIQIYISLHSSKYTERVFKHTHTCIQSVCIKYSFMHSCMISTMYPYNPFSNSMNMLPAIHNGYRLLTDIHHH